MLYQQLHSGDVLSSGGPDQRGLLLCVPGIHVGALQGVGICERVSEPRLCLKNAKTEILRQKCASIRFCDKKAIVPQKEALVPKKEALLPQKEGLAPQKEALVRQKVALVPQKEALLPQKEALLPRK